MVERQVADPLVGREVDGYRILEVLGRGGMGIVYKAEDVALSRLVALKMIDPALARDETFVRRFRSEARALARIDSPYIVRVHALRQTEHGLFIVMEYVEGGTLTDRLQAGPIPWQQALPLVAQMLTALEHAHSVGIIHRDIKPSNIMLSRSGGVKVTDFGLAKLSQADANRTVTQGIAGTLYYMSPEQVKGLTTLDHRSDLYSLGMTIYQMLAGELPIDRDSGEFAIMRSIVEESFPPPSRYRSDLPEELSRVVMKALEKEPDQRYQSAAEMRAAFARLQASPAGDEATVVAPPHRNRAALPSSAGRRRPLILVGGAVGVALLAVAAWLLWPEAAPTALLTVGASETGATVYVNGTRIGETPVVQHAVPADRDTLALRVEKEGFLPVDTTVAVLAGRSLTLFLTLPEAVTSASLAVRADPPDAQVFIDGEPVGRASELAERLDLPPGEHRVEVRRDGYATWRDTYRLAAGETRVVEARLRPLGGGGGTDEEPSPATATLTLNVSPSGTISVQGETCVAGQACTVRAGPKRVTFIHPVYGERTETVRVNPGERKALTYHFEAELVIQVRQESGDPIWATIYVDGEERGMMTDKAETLGPGRHVVHVERTGYRLVRVERDGAPVDPGPQTLTVSPGFDPPSHRLVFYIQKRDA
ncbi:MAG: protein kinase [Rhodothermaceae bacterium]|nr:MAG: protein kinase [Rhodothermaceae bacterium]